MKDIAIIKDNNIVFPNKYDYIYYYYNTYNNNKVLNFIYRLCRKYNLMLIFLFFGNWKKKIHKYNKFVLFDSGCNKHIVKYIKKKNPNAKLVLWYWNAITDSSKKLLEIKYFDEIWTYDPFDAKKYDLRFNPQFYFKENIKIKDNLEFVNDVVFLGKDKGRKEQINGIKEDLEKRNIKCIFHVIESKKDYIKYEDYIEEILKSKCVLDYNHNLPGGLTLRPLEALFSERKLITNNIDIKNYRFYNKNNIFIIGEDDIKNIKKFIDTDYKKINTKDMNYYSFEEWLNRLNN